MTVRHDKSDVHSTANVERAIAKLRSLQDGDIGVLEVVACGARSIPALRSLLFSHEPSGLFQPRCRAVEALKALAAQDVLMEFLSRPRAIDDPVEQTGEDAVINAAARSVARLPDERDFPVLLELAQQRPLAGVIAALGAHRRLAALPCFIDALGEDFSRSEAEDAIRELGKKARAALLDAAAQPASPGTEESESSRRRRRSALKLLNEIGCRAGPQRRAVHRLAEDGDPHIAVLACKIVLGGGDEPARRLAARRLLELLPMADWLLGIEIEDCLAENFATARELIVAAKAWQELSQADRSPLAQTQRALRRIEDRVRGKVPQSTGFPKGDTT